MSLITILAVRDGDLSDNEANDEDFGSGLSGSGSSDWLTSTDDPLLGFFVNSRKAIPTLACTRLKVRASS